ncbi:MAG: hypothetical protein ACWGQW_00525 [bacterium]
MSIKTWWSWRRLRAQGYRKGWGRMILNDRNSLVGFFHNKHAYLYRDVLQKISVKGRMVWRWLMGD